MSHTTALPTVGRHASRVCLACIPGSPAPQLSRAVDPVAGPRSGRSNSVLTAAAVAAPWLWCGATGDAPLSEDCTHRSHACCCEGWLDRTWRVLCTRSELTPASQSGPLELLLCTAAIHCLVGWLGARCTVACEIRSGSREDDSGGQQGWLHGVTFHLHWSLPQSLELLLPALLPCCCWQVKVEVLVMKQQRQVAVSDSQKVE